MKIFNIGGFIGKKFNLTEQGSKDLNKAIWACVLTNIAAFFPFFIFLQIVTVVITPLINGSDPEWWKMWAWFGGGVLAAIVYFFCSSLDYNKTYVASYSESEKNRTNVAERIRKLPMSFFFHKDLSELTTNMMSDCTNIEHVLSHVIPQMVASAISTVIICIALAVFNWILALSVFCMMPISFLIIIISKKQQAKRTKAFRESHLAVSNQTQEYIEGIKVIKAFGTKGKKFENVDKSLKKMNKLQMKMEFGTGVLVTSAVGLLQAGIGIVVFVGTTLLTKGSLDFAIFLTFVLISARIYTPIITILSLIAELFYFATTTKRMRTLAVEPIMTGKEIPLNSFDIQFDNVSFAYNDALVIKDLSATLKQNEVTAIVGPSGSGKSTMARLIARFFDVNKGAVTIGGVDVKTLDPEYLMSYTSFVFQDVILFNDTVLNNIRIGKNGASDEEVLAAAKAANCDEFIAKMPDGYNSIIGENGCTLSGGERQRISIARALLKDAPIILLDEATASLDPENETQVQEAISKLIKNKTVIVIAHRLRTITEADNILVLDNGKLVESGSHKALLKQGGLYAKLVNIQNTSQGFSIA